MPSTQLDPGVRGHPGRAVQLGGRGPVALKTTPPEAGRTAVWIRSLTWSTTGTLSSTTRRASSTAMTASTQPSDSQS